MGPAGLARLMSYRQELLDSGVDPASDEIKRADNAIDRVAGAKYSSVSGLYWYTDFDAAKEAAAKEGKSILSLRMLGNLTDELSCANSRFFRTTLYSNTEIAKLLNEKFVLHWKSVRPVPKITIDFGDGRTLERTITGNSAHYVLLADGTVVDCLPGLFGPQAFKSKLEELLQFTAAMPADADARKKMLVNLHEWQERRLIEAWQSDLAKVGVSPVDASAKRAVMETALGQGVGAAPPADAAAAIARPKSLVEMPSIKTLVGRVPSLEQATSEQVWEKIAALHLDEARLDDASRRLIASHRPTAARAGALAITKRKIEDPLVRIVRNLEESVALDTVRNEYELHRKLHHWFVEGSAPADVDELNERVYAELFLTPRSDPWLGLLPADAYAALPNNGVVTTSNAAKP
jgi:hypothetical protein